MTQMSDYCLYCKLAKLGYLSKLNYTELIEGSDFKVTGIEVKGLEQTASSLRAQFSSQCGGTVVT